MDKILFALDYDETYTKDPDLWLTFISSLRARGHSVIIATMRYPVEINTMDVRLTSIVQVEFTSGRGKREALRLRHIYPDIWIDDRPEWIVDDA